MPSVSSATAGWAGGNNSGPGMPGPPVNCFSSAATSAYSRRSAYWSLSASCDLDPEYYYYFYAPHSLNPRQPRAAQQQ
eukprot:21344-Heterococcus_DN1.PRE.1